MENENIKEFYDNFVTEQIESGINDRIYALYKKILKLGLRSRSNVIELGCGVGAMTFLLAKRIKKGRIEAVDISEESVTFSRKRIKNRNVTFIANDIVNHVPALKNPDFIFLFDVIEHIPADRHHELFKNIAGYSNNHTLVVINIPNPDYIKYDMINNPEALQIIDQPLPLKFIAETIENNDLEIIRFETYSVWVENDYQFFVVRKKREFKEIHLRDKRNLFQKVIKRAKRFYIKMRYNYH